MRPNYSKHLFNSLIVGCLFFAAAVSINSDSLNSLALYVAIPLAFILSFLKCGKLVLNRYQGVLLAIYVWDLISALWAQYPASASRELHRVLGAVLLTFIMAANGGNNKLTKYLYITYLILYLGCWYYSVNHSLIILDQYNDSDRLNDEKLNANTMAYYTFYVSLCLYLLANMVSSRFWNKILRIAFLGIIPLSLFVALTTSSRQVLIIQIPLITLLLFERYFKNARRKIKILFVITTAVVCVILLPMAIDMYDNSYLAVRATRNLQDDSRWHLLNDAIKVGSDHFPFGVGAGNYINYSFNRHFSHCSFTELFANNGIIGLLLYCYLLYYYIKCQRRYYRQTKDRTFIIFLIFGIIFTFDQIFYVFYTDLWLIAFFVLVATHSDSHYRHLISSKSSQPIKNPTL